jgi:membrane fusion protein (multidrug efflux system)
MLGTPPRPRLLRHPALGFAIPRLALTALVLVAAQACGRQDQQPQAPPLPVRVVPAQRRAVPITLEHPGRTAAVNMVDVRARVPGTLEKALFREGSDVQKGDLLFVIEQAPYLAALAEAEGSLARARASAVKAMQDWKRVESLFAQGVASAAGRDATKAALEEAQADVRTREAALEKARLDLGYTEVRAAIAGRVGRIRVDVGNLVGAGEETLLTTLVQLDPIEVYFNPPEQERLEVIRGRETGRLVPRDEIEVRLSLADGTEYPEAGRIDFVDNAVDPSAGTVQVRAVFPNPDAILLPGEYAKVSVVLGREDAILVPEQALIEEQDSTRVLVAGSGDVVESRSVQAAGSYQGWRVIRSGLEAGERVLVDNLQRAGPGMRVSAREESPGSGAVARSPAAEATPESAPKADP